MKKALLYSLLLSCLVASAQAQYTIDPTMIIGVWESTDGAPRAVFKNGQVIYTEAEPMPYKVKGRKIIYKSAGQTYSTQIVKLTFDSFVEKMSSGSLVKWTRVVEIPANYKQLLQGSWEYRPANQGMPSFLTIKGNQADLGMMGTYTYKVTNKTMYFSVIKNGANFHEKIVYIDEKQLALLAASGGEIQVYQKK